MSSLAQRASQTLKEPLSSLTTPDQSGWWLERGHKRTKYPWPTSHTLLALGPSGGGLMPWACPPRAPSTLCFGVWAGARGMAHLALVANFSL